MPVNPYLLLPCFKDITIVKEIRLHLIDTTRGDKDEVEDGKESELQI